MRRVYVYFLLIFLLFGFALMLYPHVRGPLVNHLIEHDAQQFLESVQEESKPVCNPEQPLQTEPAGDRANPDWDSDKLLSDMVEYNHKLYLDGQKDLNGESAYQEPSFLLEEYGRDDDIFGVLIIPKMDLEMPLYLGANYDHMSKGAAHLSQTSLPIGGENTNAVIAGHRGWKGAKYFRYINKLKIGDRVYMTNLWEELVYEVTEIRIIEPYQIEAIYIQQGRELLTLLTCHPYASGGKQRYLVICERIMDVNE